MDIVHEHEKLKLRSYATKSGWKISPFTILRVVFNKVITMQEIQNSFNAKFENVSQLLSPAFEDQIAHSNSIHVLLIKPETINSKIQRIFTSKTNLSKDIVDFLGEIISLYTSTETKITSQEPTGDFKFDILITAVVSPIYSGISYNDESNSLIEVGFGQMIAKGEVNTSSYPIKDDTIINPSESFQKLMISIIDGKTNKININKIPKLDLSGLIRIKNLTNSFNVVSNGCFSIEWFQTEDGDLYFHDAMPDMKKLLPGHQNSKAELNWVNTLHQNEKKEDPNAFVLFPGEIKGKIILQDIQSTNENPLDLHHLDEKSDSDNSGETDSHIYICQYPSLKFRHLIKPGCGFIFKEGSPLCHLANLLRESKIPSCISNILAECTNLENATLRCSIGTIKDGDYKEYKMSLEKYESDINQSPLILDFIILPTNSNEEHIETKTLGGKIKNINHLKLQKKRIPQTFIIPAISLESIRDDKSYFEGIIRKFFSEFASMTNYLLICRSSAENEDSINSSASGLYDSVSNIKDFNELWNAIDVVQESAMGSKMNIIIQEWIKPLIGGVVFTRNPTVLSDQKTLYFDYQLKSTDATTSGNSKSNLFQIPFQAFNDTNSVRTSLKKHFNQHFNDACLFDETFFSNLILFLQGCIELDSALKVPLDIEFVCSPSLDFYFLQMRPIIYQK